MALHGPIMVNSTVIGQWSAQRIVTAEPNVYRCAVAVAREGKYPLTDEFEVEHDYKEGALALAVKVLTRALPSEPVPTVAEAVDLCRHGEPEDDCASCAACAACQGDCGVCPFVPVPAVDAEVDDLRAEVGHWKSLHDECHGLKEQYHEQWMLAVKALTDQREELARAWDKGEREGWEFRRTGKVPVNPYRSHEAGA